MTLLNLETFYVISGVVVALVALRTAFDRNHPKRWGSALFWALLSATLILGKLINPLVIGYLLVGMVILAALNLVGKSNQTMAPKAERMASAERLKFRVILPALLIPGIVILGSFLFWRIKVDGFTLVTKADSALVALSLAGLLALALASYFTRPSAATIVNESSRLLQGIGWPLLLPQLLAALGVIFEVAGVGNTISRLTGDFLPTQFPFVAVAAYCAGMALFTIIMGNAFAAFSVITLGIGLPLIVQQHGGNPAIMAALGMLAGYCGTLCTPMAANFNLVPAMLLELEDPHAVIKAQLPFAGTIFVFNLLTMYLLVYRF